MTKSELDPGYIIADLLASTMLRGFEQEGRSWIYIWELQGCQYLLQRLDAGTYKGNLWTADFVRLNQAAIRKGENKMNFNLRAAREADAAPETKTPAG